MGNKKNRQKKTAQANARAQPNARPPAGQPSVPMVQKSGQKKKPGKGAGKGPGRGISALRKKGGKVLDLVAETVPEEGLLRHCQVIRAHTDAVMAIVMTPDAVYTASRDKLLKRWRPQRSPQGAYELIPEIEVPLGDIAWCLISAGEWLFCGLGSGVIKGFSKAGGEMKLEGHTKRVTCLLIQEHVLISGSADGTVRFWQMDPGRQTFVCTHTISEGISSSVNCIAALGEGLWVGGTSGVSLVELASLRVVSQLEPKKHVTGLLQFTGHMIVVYADGTVIIFTATGQTTFKQSPLPAGPIMCVAGLDSGPRVLCGHTKGQVSSITLPMFKLKKCWQALERCKVQSLFCAGHDGIFLVGAENGNLQLWQRDAGAATECG